jgi:ABC-type Fe3+-hydroxamate transport system substrate-binding protein
MPPTTTDALDRTISLDRPAGRVVSLVPSQTETVALFDKASALIACTQFCTEPADVVDGLRKIGGTKDPDIEAIIALQPDLVLANKEENRQEDVEALIEAGLSVFVGYAQTVRQAATEMESLIPLLGSSIKALKFARELKEEVERQTELAVDRPAVRVFCPIWRKPYMAVGGDTYGGDVLRLAGGTNVFESHRAGGRYPQISITDLEEANPQIILLPSEPFHFRERHRDEIMALRSIDAVQNERVFLTDGRSLTWHGPRAAAALQEIAKLLDQARPEYTPPVQESAAITLPGATGRAPTSGSAKKPQPPSRKKTKQRPAPRQGAELPPGLRLDLTQQDVVDEQG